MMKDNSRRAGGIIIAILILILTLTACGKSEFGLSENTGKQMTVTAQNADKDAFFMVGSLDVADGEQIVITSNLTKGSVRVEIVATSEEPSIDKLPDLNGEAIITADLEKEESVSGTVAAGSYVVGPVVWNLQGVAPGLYLARMLVTTDDGETHQSTTKVVVRN